MKSQIQSASILFSILATVFGGASSPEASGTIASYVARKKRDVPLTIDISSQRQETVAKLQETEQKAA